MTEATAVAWNATLVHGNDDVAAASFATVDAALAWARAEEETRHPHSGGVFNSTFQTEREDFVQYGTGYHWLTVERTEAVPARKAVPTEPHPGEPAPDTPDPWADGPLAGYAEAMTEAAAALADTHAHQHRT